MVFKRYIHRNGKKFGPYYYESYRDKDGIKRTRYVPDYESGRAVTHNNNLFRKHSTLFILLGTIIIIFLSISFLSYQFSEKQQRTGNNFFENVGSKVYSFFTGFTTEGSITDTTTSTISSEANSGASDSGSGSTTDTTLETSQTETTIDTTTPTETQQTDITSVQTSNETINPSNSENITQTPGVNNTETIPSVESNVSTTNKTIENNETNATIQENQPSEGSANSGGVGISNITNGTIIGNESIGNFSNQNITVETNVTNETITNKTSNVILETSVKQYGAVLGKPVRWEKRVKVSIEGNDSVENLKFDLPNPAGNVSVKRISDTGEEKVNIIVNNEKTIADISPSGEKIEASQGSFLTTAFNFILGIIRFTGNVVNGGDDQNVSVEISSSIQNQDELVVEYYTNAPYLDETDFGNGSKQESIIGPKGINYENVLAFTELKNETNKSRIKLYQIDDGKQIVINISLIDSNNNSLIDRIEWIVPNLNDAQIYVLKIGGREIRFIVKLKDQKTKKDISNFGETEKSIKTEKNNFEVISVNEDNVDSFKNDPNVESLTEDQPVSLLLNDSEQIVRSSEVKTDFGLNGAGQKICVIDTGVDYNHPGITNYLAGFDFVNNDSDPMDDNGHGTSVAGVVSRIAPGSELYIAKVIYANGTGYESTVLQGLQWCIDQNVSIISFSIGAGSYDGFCDTDFVAELANNAVSRGIFVVAGTGNDGNISLKIPACASNVTRVSSTTKQDGIALFSSGGEKIDVFAPGVDVNVPVLGGGSTLKSGVSISTPMVAAGASIVLQNESLFPSDLKYRLRSTGKPILYNIDSLTQINISRLDVYNAVINNKTMEPFNYSGNQSNVTQNQTFELLDTTIHYYNFSDTTNNKAYNGSDGSNPPTDPWVSGPTELNSTNYFNLNISDDKYHSTSGSDAGVNWYNIHKAVFKITESVSSINSINFTWEGYNTKGFELASQNDLYLYVYNFTSGSWGSSRNTSCENNACTSSATQKNLTAQISSGFSDIINSTGYVWLLVAEFEGSELLADVGEKPEIEYLNDTANSRGINNLTPTTRKYYTVFTDRMEVQVNYTIAGSNNAPTQSTPLIVPSTAYNTDNITCVNQSTTDADGDAVTNVYNWLVNSTNATSISTTLLYLPFDINSSNTSNNAIRDYSGFGNNGTLGGGNATLSPTWNASGKIGGAYTFDGVDDVINITKSSTLNNVYNFSVDVWIRPNITSGAYYIFNNYPGGSVSDGQFLLYLDTGKINSFNELAANVVSDIIVANNWYHVAVVMINGSSYKLYINGALNKTDSTVGSGPFLDLNNNFSIGMATTGENPFSGNIDNLRVWNRSLSPEQVNQLYLEGANNYANSTIAYPETNSGENWTCQVFPNDAKADGTLAINSTIILTSRPPTSNLVSPSNNSRTFNGVTFNCNATDDIGLQNISLYGNWSGSWLINQTNNVSGTSNSTDFTISLTEGTFLWSCLAYDNDSNSAFASSNFTVYNDACASTNIAVSTVQSADTCDWYNFTASNIYLDCSGYKISRYNTIEDWAVQAQNLTNVSVKNCYFANWTHGIYYYNTTYSNITNTTFYNLTDTTSGDVEAVGIKIGDFSNNSVIDGVNITLVFANSSSVTLCYNNSNSRGIWIASSNTTTVKNSILSNVVGYSQGFYDSIDQVCLADNRISLGEGIHLENSHNFTMINTSLNIGYYGINATSSNYTNITQSNFSFFNFTSAGVSAFFKSSYFNYVTYNIFNNSNTHIQFSSSPNASVTNNEVYNATGNNIVFSSSSNYPIVGYNIISFGSGRALQFATITGGKIENNTIQHLTASSSGAVVLSSVTSLQSFKNNTLFDISGANSFAVSVASQITATGNNLSNLTQGYSFSSGSSNSQVFNDSITNVTNVTVVNTGVTNISFYNVTYNHSAVVVQGTGTFYNYYYLRVNVIDQVSNGVSSASVNITNSTGSGSPENTITTDVNGFTSWTTMQTFNKSSSLLTNHTPHNITAFKTGYSVNYSNENMYQSRLIQLTISTPYIQAYAPSTDVFSITEPNNQTFSIVISNTTPVDIKWFVNGTQQSAYDNNTQFIWVGNFSQEGFYLIKVNVSNSFGEDQHIWNMTVNNTPAYVTINNTYPVLSLNASQNKFFNVTLNVTCSSAGDNCGTINVTLYANNSLANITTGTTPFYTNASTNPLTTTSLNSGQSATITFWLNATGNINTTSPFFAYANLTSNLSINNKTSNWNVTITDPFTLAIDLSSLLGSQINWTILSIPTYNQSADGNNGTGVTRYWVNVSVGNGNADIYIRANANLTTSGGSILQLGNETYSYNSTNSSVPNDIGYQLTTNFSNNKIGSALSGSNLIYLKFFLTVPLGQPAGIYNNTVEVRGVETGQVP
ncbi:MAG: S8 family serine peptidase [Nanoarchaeota archaeon]